MHWLSIGITVLNVHLSNSRAVWYCADISHVMTVPHWTVQKRFFLVFSFSLYMCHGCIWFCSSWSKSDPGAFPLWELKEHYVTRCNTVFLQMKTNSYLSSSSLLSYTIIIVKDLAMEMLKLRFPLTMLTQYVKEKHVSKKQTKEEKNTVKVMKYK